MCLAASSQAHFLQLRSLAGPISALSRGLAVKRFKHCLLRKSSAYPSHFVFLAKTKFELTYPQESKTLHNQLKKSFARSENGHITCL